MVLDDIRAEVNARFASGEFIPRLMEAMYKQKLRSEMKHLWSGEEDFKGADSYRLYVREKIMLAQRKRHWEEVADFYAYQPGDHKKGSYGYDEAISALSNIEKAEKKLAQKRLDIRKLIGEITYV